MLTSARKVVQWYAMFLLIRYLKLYTECYYTMRLLKHLNIVTFNTDMDIYQLHNCHVLSV